MSDGSFRRLGEHDVHQGHIWRVVVAEFEAPDGQLFRRDIVRSPGAVGVVPVLFDPEGEASVVVVRQYRPPYETEVIEIPAGMRDVAGEPPAETARRELAEEAGLQPERLEHLLDMLPSPGLTDSVTSIYLATGCTPVPREVHGPEEQHMELLTLPISEAVAMIESGEIRDAKTVAGILLTERRLRRGDGLGR